MPSFKISFDTQFMDRLNRMVAATERQAVAAEKLNEILATPADDNTVDPAQMEALRSQLAEHTTALKNAEDNAATP